MLSRFGVQAVSTSSSVGFLSTRFASSAAAVSPSANDSKNPPELTSELFNDARHRVYGDGRSVEKVVVAVKDKSGDSTKNYLLNRNVSTAFTCAKHISRNLISQSGLALLSYESGTSEFVSLNMPLTHKSDLEFIDFNTTNQEYAVAVNNAYWRSASVLLAAVLKRGIDLNVKTLPVLSNVQAYFEASVEGAGSWEPTKEELHQLSRFAYSKFIAPGLRFDFISIPEEIAPEYGFEESVQLCRLGDYVAVVDGPTIPNTQQIGRFSIVKALSRGSTLNFAGTSVPTCQPCNTFNWELIQENAQKKFL